MGAPRSAAPPPAAASAWRLLPDFSWSAAISSQGCKFCACLNQLPMFAFMSFKVAILKPVLLAQPGTLHSIHTEMSPASVVFSTGSESHTP
jgi:hypothetical protein